MLEPARNRIWQAALQTGLVDSRRLAECWDEIPPEKRTPDAIDRRLARRLVDRGFLTRWQAQQLLVGIRPQALWYDKYVIQDIIGQGGMGRVYLAKDSRLGRLVALKVLSRERMNNPRALMRFRRESKVGAQLQHENLVRIYDEGEVNGQLFLVMEYIEGKTVSRLVAELGPLPLGISARIARQIALGLAHAHEKGLVHRDVNPTNILIDRAGVAKLTDLGLAIDLGDQGDAVTRDGSTVGTFDYISPEQARHSRQIDIRSDIYSLGCSLYHMLTGRVPFAQPSLPEKLYGHQMLEPESIRSLRPEIPEAVESIVRKMMAKRPEDRYDSPQAVADALEPYQCGGLTLKDIESSPEVPLWVESGQSPEPDSEKPDSVLAPEQGAAAGGPSADGEKASTAGAAQAVVDPARGGAARAGARSSSAVNSDIFAVVPKLANEVPGRLSDLGPAGREPARPESSRRAMGIVAALLAIVAFVAILRRLPFEGGVDADQGPASPRLAGGLGEDKGSGPGRLAAPAISVLWLRDQSTTPHENLEDAIRQAIGKQAEVVLHPSDHPLEIPPAAMYQVNSGRLVIRGADPARRTEIIVPRNSNTPFLRIGLRDHLVLRNLVLRPGPVTTPTGQTATLLEVFGALTMENCQVEAYPPLDERTRMILSSGLRLTLTDCVFRGCARPIEARPIAGSEVVLRNCLILGPSAWSPDQSAALTLVGQPLGAERARRLLTLERCTVVQPTFLDLAGFQPGTPLSVELSRCIVQCGRLLTWRPDAQVAGALEWKGGRDFYAVSAGSWIAPAPGKPPAVPPPPVASLEAWRQLTGSDADAATGDPPFPAPEGLRISAYTPRSEGGEPIGFDPTRFAE